MKTMEAYGAAKRSLFIRAGLQCAIINGNDAFGQHLLATLPNDVEALTYGIDNPEVHVNAHEVTLNKYGIQASLTTPWGGGVLHSPMLGAFNVSNLLAVLTALCANGKSLFDALECLQHLPPIPGRMQCITHPEAAWKIVIDYAHTPDALSQALQSLRKITSGTLWCVFGCGGERDIGKRGLMGEVAQRFADQVVVTNDNPRRESPEHIAQAILKGMQDPNRAHVVLDRREAIAYALHHLSGDDVVLIAGKGHEHEQHINGDVIPFNDYVVANECLLT